MKMWIARDEGGCLKLFDVKPQRFVPQYSKECVWIEPREFFNYLILSPKLFPEVTFENSPMEVELVIKK